MTKRLHIDWDSPGIVGTIQDEDGHNIAIIEVEELDPEADAVINMMVAGPQLADTLQQLITETFSLGSKLAGSALSNDEFMKFDDGLSHMRDMARQALAATKGQS